jgi:hypothetical protein
MLANKFTESLTRGNAAVVLIDHQVGLYSGCVTLQSAS